MGEPSKQKPPGGGTDNPGSKGGSKKGGVKKAKVTAKAKKGAKKR